jgi:uncharacterized membrane protein (DUF485 family)
MDDAFVRRIRANPEFAELERRRNSFRWILCAIMLAIYYGFVLLVAFASKLMGEPLGGSVITIGFPLGLGVIVSAIVLTGIYVWRANSVFDRLNRDIVEATR